MISAHYNTAEPPGQISNLVGIGAIANDILEIPDHVMLSARMILALAA